MCGACPGGTKVSALTAELNRTGTKRFVLAEFRKRLRAGTTLTLFGDSWAVRRRTGRQDVFQDVEQLIEELTTRSSGDWVGEESPRSVVTTILRNQDERLLR